MKVQIPVEVYYGSRRHTVGEVVNLSRDGAALDAVEPLAIGNLYRFHFRGFGAWPGIVVKRYGAKRHGVKFDADEAQKCQIDEVMRSIQSASDNAAK